jgi:hypothetical protein
MAAQEARWLCTLLREIGHPQPQPVLWCDNQSTIALTKDPVFHARTKHIEMRYFFIRDLVQRGQLQVQYVNSASNLADIFTKAIAIQPHQQLTRSLGLLPPAHSGGAPKGS